MNRDRLARYLDELRSWARRTNLVGSTEDPALSRHVEDSLAAAPHLPEGARVADLGSGAGFPGIPLAVARPDLQLLLVEIRERRAHFLRHVVRTLDLPCEVGRQRIEDAPDRGFDFALLRAVAPPEASLKLAEPWVEPGGEIWLWAGPRADAPEPKAFIPLDSGGRILRFAR
ncbi:MAG: 16S rRNA (guanine(527)-N(7))-methyltransferase RsmG [Proteobacteria bacterium]|nr:16S rRNA (guanine(527)-N(7))-methyltransferase RsmG [Pseudomonadota bacterium]